MTFLLQPFSYSRDDRTKRRYRTPGLPALIAIALAGCQPSQQRFSQLSDETTDRAPLGISTTPGWQEVFMVANDRYYVRPEKSKRDEQRGADLVREADELISKNLFKQSLNTLAQAASNFPESSIVYERLGQVLLFKGHAKEATFALRAAVDEDSQNTAARALLGKALLANGAIDEAIVQWTSILATGEVDGEAHKNLAICYYYSHDYALSQNHSTAAAALGHDVPAQLSALLSAQLAELQANESK